MTYTEYLAYVEEAKRTTAEMLLGEYGYTPNCEWTADGLINAFKIIYAVSRNDFASLVEGKNLSAFCRAYNIPLRSAQNWQNGARKAPAYVLQMIGFVLISECEKERVDKETETFIKEELTMKYYVIDDEKVTAREAFVADDEKTTGCIDSYSGYYIVKTFETETEAKEFCEAYNNYEGEEPVRLCCCSRGCTMSAFDYSHWNGCCAYEGQFDEDEDD